MIPSMDSLQVGVLGIGQMGVAAAICFSRVGYPVLLWARNPKKLEQVPEQIATMNRFLEQHVGPAPTKPGVITTTTDLQTINQQADVLLECVAEDLDQKAELLKQLRPAAQRGAVLTSCTSGLSISEMGRRSGTGQRLVGAHFWNPPHLMPIVEVIRGAETDDGLVEFTSAWLKQVGKIPVVCKDVPGFIGNRMLHALWREAIHLVQEGVCSPGDVDLVARLTFGLRLPAVGPFENIDLVGLDLVAAIQSYLLADLSDAKGPMPILQAKRSAGQTGMSTGQGFHDWTERNPQDVLSRRDQQIVHQLQFLGLLKPSESTKNNS